MKATIICIMSLCVITIFHDMKATLGGSESGDSSCRTPVPLLSTNSRNSLTPIPASDIPAEVFQEDPQASYSPPPSHSPLKKRFCRDRLPAVDDYKEDFSSESEEECTGSIDCLCDECLDSFILAETDCSCDEQSEDKSDEIKK